MANLFHPRKSKLARPHTGTQGAPAAAARSRIVGMMSGTSVDSIDAALCDIRESAEGRLSAEVLAFHEHPMDPQLRGRIFRLFADELHSLSLACTLNFEIGAAFGEAATAVIHQAGVPRESITAIASHGQTAYHIPPHMAQGALPALSASTLQIGEGSVIAEHTGLPVICDFRVADMAVGGNGAPLVPFADFHLFSRPGEGIIVQNIGGIANCTVLPASGSLEDVMAFDTGPGNMLIDAFVQHFYRDETFDRDGMHARAGTPNPALIDAWMSIPYISAAPPKTTGRELFGAQMVAEALRDFPDETADNLIAAATLFTARSIAVNLRDHAFPVHPIREVLLAGGGAHNAHLASLIRSELADAWRNAPPSVRLLEEIGFSSKARECVAFALLGHARLRGISGNVPAATGARRHVLLGKIVELQPHKELPRP